jgi:hypothetical protein
MLKRRTQVPYSAIRSRSMLIFFVCSAIWVLLLYWRALFNPFASYDDLTNVVNNPRLSSWHSVVYYLRTNVSFVDDLRGSGEVVFSTFLLGQPCPRSEAMGSESGSFPSNQCGSPLARWLLAFHAA